MRGELAQIVTDLVERILVRLKAEVVEDGGAQPVGSPCSEAPARPAQQHFQEPHDARILQLDPGDLGSASDNRTRDVGDQVEMAMHIEMFSLRLREAVQHRGEPLPDFFEVAELLADTEVAQVVAHDLQAQEGAALLVRLEKGMLPIGAIDMHAAIEPLEHALQLAFDSPANGLREDLSDVVGSEQIEGKLARPLEEPTDGTVALEDEVAAELDLLQGL